MRFLTIRHAEDLLEVIVDGTPVVSASDVPALFVAAEALEPNPLLLGADDHIDLELKVPERSAFLEACTPAKDLADYLDEHYEDAFNDWDADGLGIVPILTGTMVDSRQWAWHSRYSDFDNGWFLAPASERHPIIDLHAGFNEGMVDLQILAGAWRWDEMNALVWSWRDDSEPSLQICWPFYDGSDDEFLCDNAFSVLFPDVGLVGPSCPYDEASVPEFTMNVQVASITDDMIGQGLAQIWRPCNDHLEGPLEISGRTWRWAVDRWVPVEKE